MEKIECEKGFEHPRKLKNSLEVEDKNGRKIRYIASAWEIRFEEMYNVRGGATIQKLILIPQPDRKIFNWRQFRLEVVSVDPVSKVEWSFSTNCSHDYFISRGKITGLEYDFEHKGDLIRIAATHDVFLTGILMQAVFGPVEKKLLRFQQIIQRHGLNIIAT